jgi:hypothetical protein
MVPEPSGFKHEAGFDDVYPPETVAITAILFRHILDKDVLDRFNPPHTAQDRSTGHFDEEMGLITLKMSNKILFRDHAMKTVVGRIAGDESGPF